MTATMEILSVVVFMFTSLSILACVMLAAQADQVMKPRAFDSDFEEV